MNATQLKTAALAAVFVFLNLVSVDRSFATPKNSSNSAKVIASLNFALPDEHGFPNIPKDDEFGCTDKIYAVTELSHLTDGKHEVEFRWIDPYGNTRERTKYDFFPNTKADNNQTKLWAWLELSPAKGANLIRWLNSAAGMEEFIGEWELELYVDYKRVQQGAFQVAC